MDYLAFSLFWVFGWLVLLVVVWHLAGQRKQRWLDRIHAERLIALEKGIPLPEVRDYGEAAGQSWLGRALSTTVVNPRWPLGVGVIFIMTGIGTSLGLGLSGDSYHNDVASTGLIGVFFGLGLVLHYFLTRPPRR